MNLLVARDRQFRRERIWTAAGWPRRGEAQGCAEQSIADTEIFRPEWRFLAALFSTTYARRPRAKLPGMDRCGHEMTGVGHDLVTLGLITNIDPMTNHNHIE